MSNEEIRDLLRIFMESGVTEMEVKRGDNNLRLRRGYAPGPASAELLLGEPLAQHALAPASAPALAAAASPPVPPSAPAHIEHIVKSPIVGTYYDAAKPGDPPFVKVGDAVEPGQVLCIIESMKLMNEIECEVAGTVAAKLMENGRPVEYGEGLFSVRPR